MNVFGYCLIGAALLGIVLGGLAVVIRFKNKRTASAEANIWLQTVKADPDWRVYAIEENGNCFCGADIILESERDEFSIGRQEGNTLRLMRPEISRRHAKVTRRGIVYIYTDLDSTCGSVCDHEKIKEKRLHHLMVVWVYNIALVFANCEMEPDSLVQTVRNSL